MGEQEIQQDIATMLNKKYPQWGAWPSTTRDNVEYVEFAHESNGERFIITIQKGQ